MIPRSPWLGVALAAALLFSALPAAAGAPPGRPPIDAAELLSLLDAGHEVRGRTIAASALRDALDRSTAKSVNIVDDEIAGRLDLADRAVRPSCYFRDSVFTDGVNVSGATFLGNLTFAGNMRFKKDLLVHLIFAGIYWTQTGALAEGRAPREAAVARARFALDFARKSALSLTYGHEHARTPLFKAITVVHSIGAKLMLLWLLKAVANVSPLLNELLGKIIPV